MVNWSIYSPGGDLICPFPSVCHIVVKTDTDGDTTDAKIDTAGDTGNNHKTLTPILFQMFPRKFRSS